MRVNQVSLLSVTEAGGQRRCWLAYAGPMGDGTGAAAALSGEIRGLIAHASERAGASPIGEVVSLAMDAGHGHAVMLGDPLSAYAHLVPNPDGAGWMVEAALADPADADRVAGAIADTASELGVERLTWWVHDAAVQIRDERFVLGRELHRMRVQLPVPAAGWPEGFEVRGFWPGTDEEAWLAVNNRAFVDHPRPCISVRASILAVIVWPSRDGTD